MSTLQIISLTFFSISLTLALFSRPLASLIVWLTWERPLERALQASERGGA
jgi:hypothetical protein